MKKCNINKIAAIVTICINVLLIFDIICLYYCYRFAPILFMFIHSDEELLINALLGMLGIFMSIMLYKQLIGIKLFSIITLVLWLIICYIITPFAGFVILWHWITPW